MVLVRPGLGLGLSLDLVLDPEQTVDIRLDLQLGLSLGLGGGLSLDLYLRLDLEGRFDLDLGVGQNKKTKRRNWMSRIYTNTLRDTWIDRVILEAASEVRRRPFEVMAFPKIAVQILGRTAKRFGIKLSKDENRGIFSRLMRVAQVETKIKRKESQ